MNILWYGFLPLFVRFDLGPFRRSRDLAAARAVERADVRERAHVAPGARAADRLAVRHEERVELAIPSEVPRHTRFEVRLGGVVPIRGQEAEPPARADRVRVDHERRERRRV